MCWCLRRWLQQSHLCHVFKPCWCPQRLAGVGGLPDDAHHARRMQESSQPAEGRRLGPAATLSLHARHCEARTRRRDRQAHRWPTGRKSARVVTGGCFHSNDRASAIKGYTRTCGHACLLLHACIAAMREMSSRRRSDAAVTSRKTTNTSQTHARSVTGRPALQVSAGGALTCLTFRWGLQPPAICACSWARTVTVNKPVAAHGAVRAAELTTPWHANGVLK
jgi:hypothetical protein